jgi:hypothetical protein
MKFVVGKGNAKDAMDTKGGVLWKSNRAQTDWPVASLHYTPSQRRHHLTSSATGKFFHLD